jgi:hypothetical protein
MMGCALPLRSPERRSTNIREPRDIKKGENAVKFRNANLPRLKGSDVNSSIRISEPNVKANAARARRLTEV